MCVDLQEEEEKVELGDTLEREEQDEQNQNQNPPSEVASFMKKVNILIIIVTRSWEKIIII